MKKIYDGRFVNKKDIVPISLMDGLVIVLISIVNFENLKDDYKHLTYGVLEE